MEHLRDTPTRALFLSEGAMGIGMMGHSSTAEGLRARLAEIGGIDARFAVLPPMGRVSERLATGGLLARVDPDLQAARWHAVQAARVRMLLRRERVNGPFDVLHVHSHTIALGLTGLMDRVPTLLSVDATILDWRALGRALVASSRRGPSLAPLIGLERRAFSRAQTVLAWSRWAAQGVLSVCPTAHVVGHVPGLDLQRFRPAALRAARERPRVLFVGARFAEKGGWDLLEALDPLIGRALDLDLVTTSEVPTRPGVRVHRLEPGHPQLVELHQQADVFCLPTHHDTSPIALREAMACAAAVLSTTVGAVPELVDHGAAGVLIAPGDREGLRGAVEDLLLDDERRRRLGSAARAQAERLWDGTRQAQELVGLIEAAARSAPGRRPALR